MPDRRGMGRALAWTLLLALTAVGPLRAADYAQARGPRVWSFPTDHGSHPAFATEWWYFTGKLDDDDGHVFGYELTFFRVALRPDSVASSSRWRARDLILAHQTVTDVEGQRFYARERVQRAAAGLAGASRDSLHVWLGRWSVRERAGGFQLEAAWRSTEDAASGGNVSPIALQLTLRPTQGPVLHGEHGLSPKDDQGLQASYYYSMPRLLSSGHLELGEKRRPVLGLSWMDHEFFTGATPDSDEGLGWDWFSCRLEDGRDLMLYRVRPTMGRPVAFGTAVAADGTGRPLDVTGLVLRPLERWTSSATGTSYPIAWKLGLPAEKLELSVRAVLPQQEVVARRSVGFAYWEGLSRYHGNWNGTPVTGDGYVELTGYGGSVKNGADGSPGAEGDGAGRVEGMR